jgi:hypothetical protein
VAALKRKAHGVEGKGTKTLPASWTEDADFVQAFVSAHAHCLGNLAPSPALAESVQEDPPPPSFIDDCETKLQPEMDVPAAENISAFGKAPVRTKTKDFDGARQMLQAMLDDELEGVRALTKTTSSVNESLQGKVKSLHEGQAMLKGQVESLQQENVARAAENDELRRALNAFLKTMPAAIASPARAAKTADVVRSIVRGATPNRQSRRQTIGNK